MNDLIKQILKFGVVGVLAFMVDYLIGLAVLNTLLRVMGPESFEFASVCGSVCGFVISAVFNYILSFRFVFERKEDLDRRAEFVAFMVLSVIGLGINAFLVWLCVGPICTSIPPVRALLESNVLYKNLAYTGGKVFATGVVMVYNFVTRKIFLEKK